MYWENENIKILTNYTNGIIQGERQYYAETGKIYKQEKYNKGIIVETVNYN